MFLEPSNDRFTKTPAAINNLTGLIDLVFLGLSFTMLSIDDSIQHLMPVTGLFLIASAIVMPLLYLSGIIIIATIGERLNAFLRGLACHFLGNIGIAVWIVAVVNYYHTNYFEAEKIVGTMILSYPAAIGILLIYSPNKRSEHYGARIYSVFITRLACIVCLIASVSDHFSLEFCFGVFFFAAVISLICHWQHSIDELYF